MMPKRRTYDATVVHKTARMWISKVLAFAHRRGCACVLMIGMTAFFASCGSRQEVEMGRPGDTVYLVRSLSIKGAKHIDQDALKGTLATKTLTVNPFGSNRPLNEYELRNDMDRIQTFMQLNGYFDAQVLGPATVNYDEEVRRARVEFEVEEGEPSVVTETRIVDGRAHQKGGDNAVGIGSLIARIDKKLPLRRGHVFSYDKMTDSASLMRRRLQELGYARARVEARAYVSRHERRVLVMYTIDPGAVCVFGDVYFSGNRRIPDRLLDKAANLNRGTDFRPSLIEKARDRLYALGELQVVEITTGLDREKRDADPQRKSGEDEPTPNPIEHTDNGDQDRDPSVELQLAYNSWTDAVTVYTGKRDTLERAQTGWKTDDWSASLYQDGYDPWFAVATSPQGQDIDIAQSNLDFSKLRVEDPHVDIYIHVTESAAATYRFGVGAEIDSGRWAAFARGNATWRDVFGPLNTFSADLRLGYAWLPSPFWGNLNPQDLRNRGIIARASVGYRRPQLLWGAWDLYAGVRADNSIELTYDLLTVGGDVGINRRWGRHYRLDLSYSMDFNRETSSLEDRTDAYRIAWFNAQVTADYRDDAMEPRKGGYAELSFSVGDPFGGEFLFFKLQPDLRAYLPITKRLTIALRGRVGMILSVPADNKVPISHRLYEGGSTSFRGTPYRRLSPHQYRLGRIGQGGSSTSLYDSMSGCLDTLEGLQLGGVGDGFACRPEPTGGFFSAVFTVEPRYELGKDWLFGAVFMDAGTVQDRVLPHFNLNGDEWHLAAGAGLRIATPLGPIRVDLAYRITTADAYAQLSKFVFFVAIGEAF